MFFYTHVVSQNLAAERTQSSSSATEDSVFFPPTRRGVSGTSYSSTGSGQVYQSNTGTGDLGGFNSGYVQTSYSFGTAPRSVTAITASSSSSTSFLDSPSSTVNSSTSSTFTIGPAGSSTGVDSITYTVQATQTYSFTTQYFTNTATTLSASASATRTTTGNRTLTLASVTTLVPLFALSMPTVRRWYEARANPPALRGAGIAFAATHTAGTAAVAGLAAGSNSYASDLSFESTTSSSSAGSTRAYNGTNGESRNSQTGETYFRGSSVSTTAWTPTAVFSAARKALVDPAFVSQTQLGSTITFSSSITATWTEGVSVAQNILSAYIFTDAEIHDSTTFVWKYQSSSWRLHATSSNTATTSTYTVSVEVSGSATTTSSSALHTIGVTTAILGPNYPFSISALDELSVSTLLTHTSNVLAYYSSRNSSAGSSASTLVTASSSTTTRLGSASGFVPATFADSLLSWAVKQVAVSVQTATWSKNFADKGNIPSIYRASKWNEAGRADPVSVNQ